MQLTWTNVVFSRIALVSSFVQKNQLSENTPIFIGNVITHRETHGTERGGRGGCMRQPHPSWARPGVGPHPPRVWPPRAPPTLPFGLLKALDLKIDGGFMIFCETHPCSAANTVSIPGIRSSVLAPCRDGGSEEIITVVIIIASPTTIHDSPVHV